MNDSILFWIGIGFVVCVGILFFVNAGLTRQNEFLGSQLTKCTGQKVLFNITLNHTLNEKEQYASLFNNASFINLNPTLKQVKDFLSFDLTNRYVYNKDFECVDFSDVLVKNMVKNHLYGCTADLWFFDGKGHTIVVVNTSDEGLVWIEPQTDEVLLNLTPGQDYCKRMNWFCKKSQNWRIKKIITCFGSWELKNNSVVRAW